MRRQHRWCATGAATCDAQRTQRLGVGRRASSVPLGLPPGYPAHRRAQGNPEEEFHGLGGSLAAPAGLGHSISKMPRTSPQAYNPDFEHHVLKINGVHTPIFMSGLVNTIDKDLKSSSTTSLAHAFQFFRAPQGGL